MLSKNFNHRLILAITGLTVLTVAISLWAYCEPYFPGDLQATLWLQSVNNKTLLSIMEWISYLMSGWRAAVLVVASAIVVWRYLGKLEAGLVGVAGLCSLLALPIKLVVNRPRPTAALVQVFATESGNGFPSGHALFAAVVLGFLAYLAITHLRQHSVRALTFTCLLILILLTGASRVYLGVHWPSDVLGGYLFGAVFLTTLIWFCHLYESRVDSKL